jgi:hypothetical protein
VTRIQGHSVYLDPLKKPFRPYELIIASTDNENHTQKYDDINEKSHCLKRRMRREGLFRLKRERYKKLKE